MKIYYAFTSHGLGHLTRGVALIRELLSHFEVEVGTTQSPDWIAAQVGRTIRVHPRAYEVGTLQKSCFELDLAGTREQYEAQLLTRHRDLTDEIDFLRGQGIEALIADVPALPVAAAASLEIPTVAVANFTWDWILASLYGAQAQVTQRIRAEYQLGRDHLRLPFGPANSPFARSEPAPLLSRKATRSPQSVRDELGLEHDATVALVCPGGWSAEDWPPISLPKLEPYSFIFVGDLPIETQANAIHLPHALKPTLKFPDLVATADILLGKPGYGLASECIAHQTPLIAIERPNFIESPTLIQEFKSWGPIAELSLQDFFQGQWQPALDQALSDPTPWKSPPNDAESQVVTRISQILDQKRTRGGLTADD